MAAVCVLCACVDVSAGERADQMADRIAAQICKTHDECRGQVHGVVRSVVNSANLDSWSMQDAEAFERALQQDIAWALAGPALGSEEFTKRVQRLDGILVELVRGLNPQVLRKDWEKERAALEQVFGKVEQRLIDAYSGSAIIYTDVEVAERVARGVDPRTAFNQVVAELLRRSAKDITFHCGSLSTLGKWRLAADVSDQIVDAAVRVATDPYRVDVVFVFRTGELSSAMGRCAQAIVQDVQFAGPRGAERLRRFWQSVETRTSEPVGIIGAVPDAWIQRLAAARPKVQPEPSAEEIRRRGRQQQALDRWVWFIARAVRTDHALDGHPLNERCARFEEAVQSSVTFGGSNESVRMGDALDEEMWRALESAQSKLSLFTQLDGDEKKRVDELKALIDGTFQLDDGGKLANAHRELIQHLTEWTRSAAAKRFTAQDHRDEHFRLASSYMLTHIGDLLHLAGNPKGLDASTKLEKVYERLHSKQLLVEHPVDVASKLATLTPFERECYQYIREISKVNPLFRNLDETLTMSGILQLIQPYQRTGYAPVEAEWRKRIEKAVLSNPKIGETPKKDEVAPRHSRAERAAPRAEPTPVQPLPSASASRSFADSRWVAAAAALLAALAAAAWFRRRRS